MYLPNGWIISIYSVASVLLVRFKRQFPEPKGAGQVIWKSRFFMAIHKANMYGHENKRLIIALHKLAIIGSHFAVPERNVLHRQ